MWIGTNKGLSRYGGLNFKTFTRTDSLLGDYIFAIAINGDGHKWFGRVNRYAGD